MSIPKIIVSVSLLLLSYSAYAQDTLILYPEYDGGDDALESFISNSTHYPRLALELNITGTVIIGFAIDEAGKAGDYYFQRKQHPSLDYEAMRVAKLMPLWKAGTVNGKNAKVAMSLPIEFSIEDYGLERYAESHQLKRYHQALNNYNDGMVLYEHSDFSQALMKFKNADILWPENYHFKMMWAKCLISLQSGEMICEILKKAIEFITSGKIKESDTSEVFELLERECN